MKDSDIEKFAPLAVVAGILIYLELTQTDGGILGTRTVTAINDFKTKLRPIADKVERERGISARLGILQASLESKYGSSDLSRPSAQLEILPAKSIGPALNVFGFKTGDAWIKAGKTYVMMPTDDYYKKGEKMPNGEISPADGFKLRWPAPFRVYASWDDSYLDWARLMEIPRYVSDGALAALRSDNLVDFGKALSIHYAPNQDYAGRLAARAQEMGLA